VLSLFKMLKLIYLHKKLIGQTMAMTIRRLGYPFKLKIPIAAKIVDIKIQLEKMIGLSPDKMDLTYNEEVLRDELTVLDYQITPAMTLIAYHKILIWIKADPVHLCSLLVRDITVGQVKEILCAEFGLDVENKRLQFPRGHNLIDRCYLFAYRVDEESELYLV
jgi:hypothetical protein